MSKDKEYSELEVALMIRERLAKLVKSANSAHEIDGGEEASSDLAECPEFLANSFSESGKSEESGEEKKEKKEGSEESEEKEESEEGMEKESEEEEKEEKPEYDFNKSEAGMHTIEYKTLKKASFATNSGGAATAASGFGSVLAGKERPATPPAPTPTPTPSVGKSEPKGPDNAEIGHSGLSKEKPKKMSNAQNATFGSSIKSGKKGSMKGHRGDSSPGQIKGEAAAKARREAMKAAEKAAKAAKEQKKSEVKNIEGMETPAHLSDKGKEEKKGIKRPLEKCGDMLDNKKSEVSGEKLSSFLKNNKK